MKTLSDLMLQPPPISTRDLARLLSKQTKRPVSQRAVQAWLTDSTNSSHRPCPKWALLILAAFRCKTEKGQKWGLLILAAYRCKTEKGQS